VSPLPGKRSDLWAQVAYYSSLGFILPAAAAAGYGIGWLLDRLLHTSPVLAIVITMLGAAGGFLELLQMLKRAERRAGGNDSDARPGPN
jgi:F0F1-type ATP synthase assembly protein I